MSKGNLKSATRRANKRGTSEGENPGWFGPRGGSKGQPNPDGNCESLGDPQGDSSGGALPRQDQPSNRHQRMDYCHGQPVTTTAA